MRRRRVSFISRAWPLWTGLRSWNANTASAWKRKKKPTSKYQNGNYTTITKDRYLLNTELWKNGYTFSINHWTLLLFVLSLFQTYSNSKSDKRQTTNYFLNSLATLVFFINKGYSSRDSMSTPQNIDIQVTGLHFVYNYDSLWVVWSELGVH